MDEPLTLIEAPQWLLKIIDTALQGLTYREAVPAINEINRQIQLRRQIEAQKSISNGSSAKSPPASDTGSETPPPEPAH